MPKSGAVGKKIDIRAGFVAYESPATESIRREGIENQYRRRIMLEAAGKSGACTLFSALGAD